MSITPSAAVFTMPIMQVPDDFKHFLDVNVTDPSVKTILRRKRSLFDRFLRYRRSDEVSGVAGHNALVTIPTTGDTMSVYVSAQFDGFAVNISQLLGPDGMLLLHNQPVITFGASNIAFYANTSQVIEIQV